MNPTIAPSVANSTRPPSVISSTSPQSTAITEEEEKRLLKELRKNPIPAGWKVYVSRTTGKPYWHNKSLNETRWTDPALETISQNTAVSSADSEVNDTTIETPSVSAPAIRTDDAEIQPSISPESKPPPESKPQFSEADNAQRRKDAYRKKLEEQASEMDLISLVQEARSQQNEQMAKSGVTNEAMKRRDLYNEKLGETVATEVQATSATAPQPQIRANVTAGASASGLVITASSLKGIRAVQRLAAGAASDAGSKGGDKANPPPHAAGAADEAPQDGARSWASELESCMSRGAFSEALALVDGNVRGAELADRRREVVDRWVRSVHDTEKAAAIAEEHLGGEAAVSVAVQRRVWSVALAVAKRSAPTLIGTVRVAHGEALWAAGQRSPRPVVIPHRRWRHRCRARIFRIRSRLPARQAMPPAWSIPTCMGKRCRSPSRRIPARPALPRRLLSPLRAALLMPARAGRTRWSNMAMA